MQRGQAKQGLRGPWARSEPRASSGQCAQQNTIHIHCVRLFNPNKQLAIGLDGGMDSRRMSDKPK